MATHVKDRVKPNKCPQCEKTFFKTFAMKKHIQSVHEGVMPFSCHACEKRFKSKTGLDYHVTLKHDANGRTFDEKTDPEEYKDNPKLAEILRRKAASHPLSLALSRAPQCRPILHCRHGDAQHGTLAHGATPGSIGETRGWQPCRRSSIHSPGPCTPSGSRTGRRT